jgi:hypothetical protein
MKNALNENHSNTNLNSFFDTIEPKEMAKVVRRVNYILAMTTIRDIEDTIRRSWLDDGFYYLTELAEHLDPVLEA